MNHLEAAPCTRRALRRVDEAKTGQHEFSIVTYNILADHWIKQNTMNKEYWYSYCPNDYKIRTQGKRSHRHMLLMAEVHSRGTRGWVKGGGTPGGTPI